MTVTIQTYYQVSMKDTFLKFIVKIKSSPIFAALVVFVVVIHVFCAIFFPYLFDKSCMCHYTTDYGLTIVMGVNFSS
jgi:hypothetical protein